MSMTPSAPYLISVTCPRHPPDRSASLMWLVPCFRYHVYIYISGAIEIPLALARSIGLAAALDTDVYLSLRVEPAGYIPIASRVSLEPLSSDDWEILEANADHLEGQMLTQVEWAGDGVLVCVAFSFRGELRNCCEVLLVGGVDNVVGLCSRVRTHEESAWRRERCKERGRLIPVFAADLDVVHMPYKTCHIR